MTIFRRRRIRDYRAGAAVAALLSLAALLNARDAQEPPPTFRSRVELVTLDVSVLDKDRRPVKGLRAGDFTILEDDTPQAVAAFDAIDLPDTPAPSAPWMRDVAPDVVSNQHEARRVVVILMDDAHTSERDMIQVTTARQIGNTVIDQLGQDDLAAVAFTDIGRWQNLTSNRAQLKAAVDSFNPHPESPFLNAMQDRYRADRAANGSTTSANPPPTCVYAGTSHGPGACVIEALKAIAQALASAPQGRKTVVYIGDGIPYSSGSIAAEAWRVPGQEIVELQALLRSLQQANVNVYALSVAGVEAGITGAENDWMRIVSEETGGRATLGTNAPETAVPQIFVENSSYYLLGFRSSNPAADGRFRRLRVKVNRPGVEVHTRSGYYAPLPEKARAAAAAAARPAVDRALSQSVPGGALPLAIAVAPIALRNPSEAALAVTVVLPESLPEGRHRVELVTTAVDEACPICKRQTQRQTIEFVPRPGAGSPAESYEMLSRLTVKPGGRYSVRAAATMDDRTGTVFTTVEVPNFSKDALSASGLIVRVAPPAVTAQARLFEDVLPVLPSAIREFSRGSTATVFLRVTQSGSKIAPVHVTAAIRDDRNEVDFTQTTTIEAAAFDAWRSADYRLNLPVQTLAPGPHLLRLDITTGSSAVTRDLRFTIR